jgi:hypothetical protein
VFGSCLSNQTYIAMDVFSITTLIRAPFYFLLYLFYDIPLFTVAFCWLIDAISNGVPFALLGRRRHPDDRTQLAASSIESHAIYEPTNAVLVALLATGLWALSLYALCVSYLPEWVVTHFYPVPSVIRSYEANHLGFAAICLPLGWALREFLYAPRTRIDQVSLPVFVPFIRSLRTVVLFRRFCLLAVLMFGETFVRTYMAVGGSSIEGAALWAWVWTSMLYAVSYALAWVENAADQS